MSIASKPRRTKGTYSFRNFDQCWYSSITGKYLPLRDAAGNKIKGKNNEPAAKKAWHLLSLQVGLGQSGQTAPATVGEIVDAYLDDIKKRVAPTTYEKNKTQILGFLKYVGDTKPANSTTKSDLKDFLDSRPWGNNECNRAADTVVAAFFNAVNRELIAKNPLARFERKPRVARVTFISDKQEEVIMTVAQKMKSPLDNLIRFMILTGARPDEASRICAMHCEDSEVGVQVVLHEHKTARHTGQPRIIRCNKEASEMIRMLIKQHPEGPLFRSKTGQGWTEYSREGAMRRLRRRIEKEYGKGFLTYGPKREQIVLYSCRHTFAKRAILGGLSLEQVAALMDNSPAICQAHYANIASCGNELWSKLLSLSN